MAAEPNLEKELSDPNSACKVTFKFVVLRTLEYDDMISRIPTKLFMTFKFFTFPESNTTECKLIDSNSEGDVIQPQVSRSYGIIRENYDENQVDIEDKKACKVDFKIDPSVSRVKDENLILVRYLKERTLSVDLFDANSKMHFGTVKLPLVTLLRQGKDLHSSGQE